MATRTYVAKSPINHDGKFIPVEGKLEMDEKNAASLVEAGVIEEAPADKKQPEGPTDHAERSAAIKDAIGKLNVDNGELWLKDGRPDAKAIEGVTGWPVSAKERDAAWAELKA